MTTQQQRFVEEYCKDCNGAAAARRAGYSKLTAKEQASRLLRDTEIRSAIAERLKEKSLTAEETTKLITDIAKSNLGEFFVVKEHLHTPDVEKHLSLVIAEIEDKISFEDEFIKRAKITDPDDLAKHVSAQERRRLEILRLQIELERNPSATRWMPGEPRLVERAEIDMVKLVHAKEGNRIKAVKHSEHGLNIEMYDASAALRDIARMHGLYEKDNKQQSPDDGIDYTKLSRAALAEILNATNPK